MAAHCLIQPLLAVSRRGEYNAWRLFIGTNDLSFQLAGGDRKDPRVKEAIDKIVAAGKRHKKFLGRPAGTPARRGG